MNLLKSYWHQLMDIGINQDVPSNEERYIRFTNLEAFFICIGVTPYVSYSVFHGHPLLAMSQGVSVFLGLMVFWLNHQHYYKTARMVFLFVVNCIILINACFIGYQSGVYELFYLSYTIPFLVFSVKDYKLIIVGGLFAIVPYFIYPYLYPSFVAYNVDPDIQLTIYKINTWVIFVLFGLSVYILAYYNYKTEQKLEKTNDRLEDQAIELKRSNEDLEQFAYIISHDLKAPVRNISSFMDLLTKQLNESYPKSSRDFVEMSKQSADRLTRQIDDMLSYCTIDRNLPPAAAVDLNQMVKTIKMELNEKIAEKNAVIIVRNELPLLNQMHSSMMHHVFQNLIANAIKFNTNAAPEVRIGYVEENGIYTFSVSDNGIGIDPSFQSKLFQMFNRLHTSDQFEGTGIGLAVCKKIITFYKGDIWFKSEPNQGTTFYFTLPKL